MSAEGTRAQIVEAADRVFYRQGFEHGRYTAARREWIQRGLDDVEHDVVTAEILEIAPGAVADRLSFLMP